MFLGIDLGTSGVKALLVDGEQRIVGAATVPLSVQRPAPGQSEQDPETWWQACLAAVDALGREHGRALAAVEGIGLAGQMHGAVLLDAAHRVLRPAILWNDTRAEAECAELEREFPALRQVTGNIAMPGFTAPKLLWVKRHERDLFERTRTVLLPKAYLRLRLTGELLEDMSDAAGTLWLDVGARDWSDGALAATGLSRATMPELVEGSARAGILRAELAARWGMTAPVVAGGAGDNAGGAVGIGAIRPGDAFLSLGTSGVVFATTAGFRPWTEAAVHAFCHALPGLWHQMGVTLSAAAALAWWADVAGRSEAELIAEMGVPSEPGEALFLPYLGGERTPHNDAGRRGVFAGLSHGTDRAGMTQAVLEGVAFSLRDCRDALAASGTEMKEAAVIGGGARSGAWLRIIASVLGITLRRLPDSEHGVAFGAARLGRLAVTGEAVEVVCGKPVAMETVEPDAGLRAGYEERFVAYRELASRVATG